MEFIIIAVLLLIAAQTTYLTYISNGRTLLGKSQETIFVDTSVLIDGRIVAVAESGFVSGTLMIPRSVVGELQYLADNADSEKRSRARHGLDIVNILQEMPGISVQIFKDSPVAKEGVDTRLLTLCKKYNGKLCTIDYNLNKVAQVEGITVLNVNDLAMSLRMAYLPGEKVMLELTSKGNDSHQAVGHLADGTMVVVEKAHQFIGSSKEIEFIRSLQTAAGKMMFARLAGEKSTQPQKNEASPKKKKLLGRAPKPRTDEQQDTQKPKQHRQKAPNTSKQPQKPRQQQSRRRPQTNEDRLVELANK
jgi:uncharacterized protein YacL